MKSIFKHFVGSERGASMVEYGLMVALVAVISVPAISMAGHETQDTFNTVGEALASVEGSGVAIETEDEDDVVDPDVDQSDPDIDDSDTSGGNGGSDMSGGDNSGDADSGDSDTNSDDNDSSGGDDSNDSGDPGEGDDANDEDVTLASPASETTVASQGSKFYWWNDTKHGGEGAWVASFEYENDWIRHQYLTLEVTRTDQKGKTSTETVKDFYVPAGGKATFEAWDNTIEIKKDKEKGVVSVEVKVVSVTTSDEKWQPVTYPLDDSKPVSVNYPVN